MSSFKVYIVLSFLFTSIVVQGQLPPTTKISLLTVAHGADAYNIFGHTAIRVYDYTTGLDDVYNYGTFNYNTDNFTLKFLRGKLEYQLSINPYGTFLEVYHQEGRAVKEQELNLDELSKNKVYSFLRTNYRPENRLYLYDFFFDNCSTRVRDIFEAQLSGFKTTPQTDLQALSYRNQLDQYLHGLDWTDFGIDIIIGSIADAEADVRAQTFLPDYLHDWAESASYLSGNQQTKLVSAEHMVLPIDLKKHSSLLITPFRLFSFLAFVELLLFLFRTKIHRWQTAVRWYDGIGYLAITITSLVVLAMWFLTDHQACGDNYNLLWANPLFLAVLMSQFRKQKRIKALFLTTVCLVISLLFWTFIPQQFHIAFIPIIILFVFKNLRQMAMMRHPLGSV